MIHHANNVRPNRDGVKVGGHQASSASVVTVMTSLYFDYLKPGDRISVKPHASPVYHAIQYLLGNLDPKYLTTLRDFHGLQAYPSRNKDPDNVDFSTGAVGLGAVAPTSPPWLTTTPEHTVTRVPARTAGTLALWRRRARRGCSLGGHSRAGNGVCDRHSLGS